MESFGEALLRARHSLSKSDPSAKYIIHVTNQVILGAFHDDSEASEKYVYWFYAECAAIVDCWGAVALRRIAFEKRRPNRSETSFTLSQFCLFAEFMRSRAIASASMVAAAIDSKL